ncbi:MAG: aminoglycoside phosphotransferase family protein [Candidatus Peribacteria bacterium]|nr:aminoglycoside phosphotransferase family protein [Candidatus Peribacteria bacterium]
MHRDLNSSNILINENNRHYFIDYYPNSYFDYYYDLACLYQYNDYKKEFLYYLKKNNIKINYARFKVNLLLIEAKKKKKILY